MLSAAAASDGRSSAAAMAQLWEVSSKVDDLWGKVLGAFLES